MTTYNLPTYNLLIEPIPFKMLKENIWNEEVIDCKLVIDEACYEIGLTFRGDHTRKFRKKSYRISFSEYEEIFKTQTIHLNAEYKDPSMIRNKLALDFFQMIGCEAPKSEHVLLQINGIEKGIYLQIESVDPFFLENRNFPTGSLFYAVKNHANFSLLTPNENPKRSLLSGYEQIIGTKEDEKNVEEFIIKINTIPRCEFEQEICKVLDVNKYLLWLCGIVCTQNYDGFIHNYALYQNSETKLFQIIPWDYDATFGRDWDGEIMRYDYVPIEGFNTLTSRLLDVSAYRMQYRTLLEEVLETSFTTKALEEKIMNLHESIRPFISKDPYKNKRKSIQKFNREPKRILQFIRERNHFLQGQLKNLR